MGYSRFHLWLPCIASNSSSASVVATLHPWPPWLNFDVDLARCVGFVHHYKCPLLILYTIVALPREPGSLSFPVLQFTVLYFKSWTLPV